MAEVDVVAVVGVCTPERHRYARRLAADADRSFWSANRLALSPDPVDEALALVPLSDRPGGAVLELPSELPVLEAIGGLAAPDGPATLSAVVCVLDAAHLLADLGGEEYLSRRTASPLTEFLARSVLTATQIEYASTVAIVGWRALGREGLSAVLALVAHLSPRARVRLHRDAAGPVDASRYGSGQDRPGWAHMPNGDFDPYFSDPRVSSLRYENVRPFHPGRLQRLLDPRIGTGEFGDVLRSAGFCRLATRPGITARWEHVGQMISLEPLTRDDAVGGEEEILAVGQDLAITGLDLDACGLVAALDEAVVTDRELAAGPTA